MVLVAIIVAAVLLMARRKQQQPADMAAEKPQSPGAYPPPADSWSASGAVLSSAPQSAHMVHSPISLSQATVYPVSVTSGSAAPITPLLPQGIPAAEASPQMRTRI